MDKVTRLIMTRMSTSWLGNFYHQILGVEASKIVAATEGTIIITFDHIGLVELIEVQITIAIRKVKLDLKITVIVLLATKNYVFNQLHPKVAKE